MNRIIMYIGIFCAAALVIGKENVISNPLAICGVVMDDPYPMKRMSMPVANAHVELRTQVYSLQGTKDVLPLMGALIDSAITDADGKFCLKNAVSTSFNIIVTHPDYRTRQIPLFASKDTTLNIALLGKNAVSFISGTVSAGCSNLPGFCNPKPIPGCSVSVSLSSYALTGLVPVKGLTIIAVTDAQGNYSIKDIPLSYNGEKVDVYATKSGASRIAVAEIKNTATTTVNFDFPSDFAGDSSFQVSPSKPTSKDSILFRFYNTGDCCCAVYRNTSISVSDSTIYISYSIDNTLCAVCECMGNGKWASFQSKPVNPGKYYVFKNPSFYCAPGTICPLYELMPQAFLGTLIVNKPTGVFIPNKKTKSPDEFTFTLAGSSVTVDLIKNSRVTLKAYSVNGALLGELYNGSLSSGSHNITINDFDRMIPANSMVILNMTVNGVTKAVKRVTAGKYVK